jgi:hypothetical protein
MVKNQQLVQILNLALMLIKEATPTQLGKWKSFSFDQSKMK